MGFCPYRSQNASSDGIGGVDLGEDYPCPQDTTCQVWDDTNSRCGTYSKYETQNAASTPTYDPIYASLLMLEYQSLEDQDGNGEIFGHDFILIEDDTEPPMLSDMENRLENLGRTVPTTKVSWSALYSWYKSGGPNPL